MNKTHINLLIGAAVAMAMTACGHSEADHEDEHGHHHHGHEHGHAEAEAPKFGAEIVVEPEVAERFGVDVDTIAAADFHNSIRATGMILQASADDAVVTAPASGIITLAPGVEPGIDVARGRAIATIDASAVSGGNADEAALAALNAATAELDRVKALYAEQLATIAELNAATAAYQQAKAAYSPRAASGTATAPIAGILTAINVRTGQYVEAGTPIATIASARNLTLRIDLPQKYYAQAPTFTDAIIDLPYGGGTIDLAQAGAKRISSAALPAAGTTSAYIPIYFSLPNDGTLLPSTAFTAYLIGSTRQGVISVPKSALSEQQGEFFVYRRLDEDCYVKVPVTTGASDGRRVEITSGVNPGDVIVTSGTTTIRLAESGSAIPEGHTHNH